MSRLLRTGSCLSRIVVRALSLPSLLVCAAAALPSRVIAQAVTVPRAATQIAAATLPLPEAMRAAATVLGYRSAATLELLRQGSNGTVCLAHNPADVDRFHVACYHESLRPAGEPRAAARAGGLPQN